ncbi:hypothetical protein [Streptomyces sp. NPDC005732]|uniref:hypothetical protein n=1 Tax=Streptomyces sp. NPDC005732 TaxID=3157057 RepID=UPI0033D51921
MTDPDFRHCALSCRKAGTHTLRYGVCWYAPQPEPTVSMSKVFRDTDGYNSIGSDEYTEQQLAELLEPALRRVTVRLGPNALAQLKRGETVGLSGGEYADLAREAAHAIVHRNDQTAPVATEATEPEHVCKPDAATYFCPTSGETESGCHGGHDRCCDRPDLHQPVGDAATALAEVLAILHPLTRLGDPTPIGWQTVNPVRDADYQRWCAARDGMGEQADEEAAAGRYQRMLDTPPSAATLAALKARLESGDVPTRTVRRRTETAATEER